MALSNELAVAKTKIRLQPYIQLHALRGGYDPTILPIGGAPLLTGLAPIGAMQSVSIENSREVNQWRELDVTSFGLIQETYPGLASYELTLERLILYQANALEELGFIGDDIMNQTAPLYITIDMVSPSNTNPAPVVSGLGADYPPIQLDGPGKVYTQQIPFSIPSRRKLIIEGVWLQDNPMKFDITSGDMKMSQSIKAKARNIYSA